MSTLNSDPPLVTGRWADHTAGDADGTQTAAAIHRIYGTSDGDAAGAPSPSSPAIKDPCIPDLLSRAEVGAIFHRSGRTLRDWGRKGILHRIKIGNSVFYRPRMSGGWWRPAWPRRSADRHFVHHLADKTRKGECPFLT